MARESKRTRVRLLFVLSPQDGETWRDSSSSNTDAFKDDLRAELRKEVPVVVVPSGYSLYTIEVGEDVDEESDEVTHETTS